MQFRFRTLNYFMAIATFFGTLIGVLGWLEFMDIGEVQPYTNVLYALVNLFLIILLRQNKAWFRRIAWAQVLSSLVVFTVALVTVTHDEFRVAWFYVVIYLAYMLLGERAGNNLTFGSIAILVLSHNFFDLGLSVTAIQTAIFSLLVFGLLSRVYNFQIKDYEMRLQNNNRELAEGIKKLDAALADAQAANKTKSLFLANMSHEIRTPMNGILSLVQVLRTTNLDEKQREYLQSIDRSGEILMALIDDVLDLARIESGKLEINTRSFRVWEFIDDILLQTEHLFDEKDIHFNVDVDDELPGYLVTDDVRLKQVVINLINNAFKFTSEGEVTLLINGSKRENNQFNLHIEVNDTGEGIPADKIDSIFEPFQQLSPARIYNKGAGLGLSICKKIIDALGGSIKVHSEQGKGSRFVLDIPLPISDKPEINTTLHDVPVHLPALDILLVEDDKISQLAIRTWLSDKQHRVHVCENGKQAVDYLKANEVDIILMDVHMPEMNGIEATRLIKQWQLSKAPIIGMTASVMNEERASYIDAGMDVLVEKPVNFERLMRIVRDKL